MCEINKKNSVLSGIGLQKCIVPTDQNEDIPFNLIHCHVKRKNTGRTIL